MFLLQTLLRQLAESKDSLNFSNQLCEQLEVKVEELEATSRGLSTLCHERQSALEKKMTHLLLVEEELNRTRDECSGMKAELEVQRRRGISTSRDELRESPPPCCCGSKAELAGLREREAKFSLRVQSSDFQKQRLEREVGNLLAENAVLSQHLEKAESDLAELQRLSSDGHDGCDGEEGPSEDHTPPTPSESHAPHVSLTHSNREFEECTSPLAPPTNSDESTVSAVLSIPALTSPDKTNRRSLFSELDSEYNSLQETYGTLLHRCTCSASLGLHREAQSNGGGGSGKNQGEGGSVAVSASSIKGGNTGGSFKALFEEVFATLRQTAQVADRLIERRVC